MIKYLFVLILITLTGCIPNQVTYIPPVDKEPIVNNTIINEPKEIVWKRLIKNISANFYVINNIDKESGFINVSYSGSPKNYVNGGQISFSVSNIWGKRIYNFSATSPNEQYEEVINNKIYIINRKMNLEGRININIIQIDTNSTQVTVNVKYVMSQSTTGVDMYGNVILPYNDTFSFSTASGTISAGGTKYIPNGELERQILDLAIEDNYSEKGQNNKNIKVKAVEIPKKDKE